MGSSFILYNFSSTTGYVFSGRWSVAGFPPRRTGPGRVRFVVDRVVLGQVFSEDFAFTCQSFYLLLHTQHHHPFSGVGTKGPIVSDARNGLFHPPPRN
jgi:hypothetical protein